MIEIIININDRKVINIIELISALKNLKDGKHQITIKDARKRSLSQNAYYWAVVVPMCRLGLYEAGYDEVKTNEDAHEILKHIHLKRRMESKVTGEVIDIAGSSSKLTIIEFSDYLEAICRWAAEYLGIVIPSPNQAFINFSENNIYMEKMVRQ